MSLKPPIPSAFHEFIPYLVKVFLDPFLLSGFASAFIASVFWLVAMTKFEISTAYPFMSLSFIFVFIFSGIFFGETITIGKIIGLIFVVLGLIISVKL
jgi:drug/metabolite transporter (DMT)-like permease